MTQNTNGILRKLAFSRTKEATYNAGYAMSATSNTYRPSGFTADLTTPDKTQDNLDTYHGSEFPTEQYIMMKDVKLALKIPRAKPDDIAFNTAFALGSCTPTLLATTQVFTARTSGVATAINAIIWDGTQFLAAIDVSTGFGILTSPDGINWTGRLVADNCADVAYNGTNLYVAVVSGLARAYTSPDAITWTQRNAVAVGGHLAVAFGNSLFVAVGASGAIETSPDGITWTTRTTTPSATVAFNDITYSSALGLFIAVGAVQTGAAMIYTSPDGITWTGRTSGTANALNGVKAGANYVIAVGASGTILKSTDGITWTALTSGIATALNSVEIDALYIRVVGNASGGASVSRISVDDGTTWVSETITGATGNLTGVADSGTINVIVGAAGAIYTTPTTVSGAFRHKIIPSRPAISAQVNDDFGGFHNKYTGMRLSDIKISSTPDNAFSIDSNWIGSGTTAISTEVFPTWPSETWVLSSDCTVYREINGAISMAAIPSQTGQNISSGTPSSIGAAFDSMEWGWNNNPQRVDGFGNQLVAQDIDFKQRAATMKATLKFNDENYKTFFDNQTALALEFNIKGAPIGATGAFYGAILRIPKAQMKMKPNPKGGPADILTQDIELTIMDDGVNPVCEWYVYNTTLGYGR